MNGATGILIGYGKGILHTLHAPGTTNLDVIPADYVVNGIISAAWKCGSAHSLAIATSAAGAAAANRYHLCNGKQGMCVCVCVLGDLPK